jgi:hypothetical protein
MESKITVDFGSHIVKRIAGIADRAGTTKSFIVRRCVLYGLRQVEEDVSRDEATYGTANHTPARLSSVGRAKEGKPAKI